MKSRWLFLATAAVCLGSTVSVAQDRSGIDPEALIERMLAVDRAQREKVRDVTFDAEYVEREDKGDEGVREKIRFDKRVFISFGADSNRYAEEYVAFYKEGELQNDETLRKEARDRIEKKQKRRAKDISWPMLRPFYPEYRSLYDIKYHGVADERIDDMVCHLFRVTAKQPSDTLINGDYYVEAENFHLVRVDFTPSKHSRPGESDVLYRR
jgi:hypothetical protein